jgi:signal transduction histidine kinase
MRSSSELRVFARSSNQGDGVDVLSDFIRGNMAAILNEWHAFATTQLPAAAAMSRLALRDHSEQILLAIANDLQSESERAAKSRGEEVRAFGRETAAATHGALRHASGFTLVQLYAEFRALRASVMRLWIESTASDGARLSASVLRFNEAIDQAVAESVSTYEAKMTQARDMCLAILGHDLRSPLAAVAGVGDLLDRAELTEATRQSVVRILGSSVDAMSGMINDLLEYSRSRLGNDLPLERQETDLADMCDSLIAEVRIANRTVTINGRGISAPHLVTVDKGRLRQAISNLLNNAIQHGDAGREIDLSLRNDGDSVEVAVCNYGKPIPANSLSTLFDPFHSVSPDAAKKERLGLGLYIARSVARAHGGDLKASTGLADGARFSLSLPLHCRCAVAD